MELCTRHLLVTLEVDNPHSGIAKWKSAVFCLVFTFLFSFLLIFITYKHGGYCWIIFIVCLLIMIVIFIFFFFRWLMKSSKLRFRDNEGRYPKTIFWRSKRLQKPRPKMDDKMPGQKFLSDGFSDLNGRWVFLLNIVIFLDL